MGKPLWSPTSRQKKAARITAFQDFVGVDGDYQQLHEFSIHNKTRFWSKLWDYCEVIGHKGETQGEKGGEAEGEIEHSEESILQNASRMPGAKWFPNAQLNFAENLLRYDDDRLAIISYQEDGTRQTLSYSQLCQQVESLATWFLNAGIKPGDRVAALLPNLPQTVVTMLAAASIGATFSSCSPDFGASGILDRFGQITPRVLVTCNGYQYNGRTLDISDRVENIVTQVESIEQVLLVTLLPSLETRIEVGRATLTAFDSAISTAHLSGEKAEKFQFTRLPFDHPLYIMYSSGTTGTPKCIVHGAGGTLLQHMKEHQLHTDLGRDDVLFFFTTCGWMMWNWLVSGLASGATLVLYDGSPFYPSENAMMDLVEKEKISVFGTSAKYLASLEKAGVTPARSHDVSTLRCILSTGSPLSHESFQYVYRDIKQDLCLSSISGGTDIISCFTLGNPALPVYAGELQCAGLGMDVHIFNDEGVAIEQQKGEMVCTSTFPSMPVGFWNDKTGEKYHKAYFDRFDNVWAHGDYGELTENNGFVIYGRSDAVLNPGGVRIGTAEIYRQVERVDEVTDSICVGQDWQGDVRVVLFVVLKEQVSLTDELVDRIKLTIRENTTPRHVPAVILAVPDIPRTISGKIVELAVRNVIHGRPVNNKDALANPDSLNAFKNIL
ncbi:MAG: acetoacetate--CoA ligase [bacterium]|nr:acetoacetate--CoA ligase [Gammaproteobacteria bacterium]